MRDWKLRRQFAAHAHVLSTLAGKQQRDLFHQHQLAVIRRAARAEFAFRFVGYFAPRIPLHFCKKILTMTA